MVEGIVLEMLALAGRAGGASERRAPAWLARVVGVLHEEFRHNLTVNGLAAATGVHPAHLSKVFRQFYGDTAGDYAHRLRIRHACQSLSTPGARLAEVALAAGFADLSHFTRVSKRLTGMTPEALRAALPENGSVRVGPRAPRL